MSEIPQTERRGPRCYEIDPASKLLPQIDAILERAWFESRINPRSLYLSINNLRLLTHEIFRKYGLYSVNWNLNFEKLVHPVTGCGVSLRSFGAGAWAVNTVVKLGEDEVQEGNMV